MPKITEVREKYLQPVQTYWNDLEPQKRKRLGLISAVLLIAIVALVAYLNYNPYVVLYSNLDSTEASAILNSLQEKGVSATVESTGTIMVPKDQEAALKMQLATEGYPKSGFSYDIYTNNVDTMATDSDRRTYLLFQLQNRMQEAIETISGVKEAVVTITLPDNGNYVLKTNREETKASVMVTLVGTEDFSRSQVNGIKQLVAKGVLGLEAENVAVINSNTGKEMGSAELDLNSEASDRLAIEKQIDDRIEDKVSAILEAVVGVDNYKVIATSRVNTDNTIRQNTIYTPSGEDNNTGVTYEEEHYLEGNNENLLAYGIPGAETNADIPTYPELTTGDGANAFLNRYNYKYYVNESKEEIRGQSVNIESISLSVVITGGDVPLASRDDLVELLAKAANIYPEDVVVYYASTSETEPTIGGVDWANIWAQYKIAIIVAAVILLILLIVLIVLLRRRKKRKEAEAIARENELLEAQRAQDAIVDLENMEETPQQKILHQVRDFADEHPEVAAQLIRSWLKGDE